MGIRGRVVLSRCSDDQDGSTAKTSASAIAAIEEADMVVVAPGHRELDVLPLLSVDGIQEALAASLAVKVLVTKIMSAEGDSSPPTTSHELAQLARMAPRHWDILLANAPSFPE
jgi:2-phospho-L-lactate transferase/gluconeogenesis factor (CofD/UPF0052 family)